MSSGYFYKTEKLYCFSLSKLIDIFIYINYKNFVVQVDLIK